MNHDIEETRITSDLHRVQVPNQVGPSGQATNVYVADHDSAVLIDAGSDDDGAIVMAACDRIGVGRISDIILTHAHQDHAGSAPAVRRMTGARVALHPRDQCSMSRWNTILQVDQLLADGDVIRAEMHRFTVFETPGHAPGHVSLYEPTLKALFAGDLISGNGTVAIVPPLGSMREYLASLRRMMELDIATIYPGHGPPIPRGNERVAQDIAHRQRREQEVYEVIAAGAETIDVITERLYPRVLPRIRPQAAGTVLAHVIHLIEHERVRIVEEAASPIESRFAVKA